jgi:hypothetical protein
VPLTPFNRSQHAGDITGLRVASWKNNGAVTLLAFV